MFFSNGDNFQFSIKTSACVELCVQQHELTSWGDMKLSYAMKEEI